MFYLHRAFSLILLCFIPFICMTISVRSKPKYPLILVPGDGGSQLEAKLDKPKVIHIWCKQKADWFQFWLNLELLVPYAIDCFADNMRLVYDPVTHTTSNSPGVQVRILGFGNSSDVEWLDHTHFPKTEYFYDIVARLVQKLNYTRDVNIRGAPYDFRKAPNEMGEYFKRLVHLIEETYYLNGNSRVVLLGHSMGNLYTLYVLNQQTTQWKNKFIKSFISLAGPWGGALKVLRLMASGDDLGVFVVNPLSARVEQRSMPSSAWLLPYEGKLFWNSSEILVESPSYNYTIRDYKRFFQDIDFPDGYKMRQDTEELIRKLVAPQVEMHCLHGTNIQTPGKLIYSKKQWYDNQPNVAFEDGDGTVNTRSLVGCLKWVTEQDQKKYPVHHQVFDKAEHMGILHDKSVLDYIQKVMS